MDFKEEIISVFSNYNIELNDDQISKFKRYFDMIVEWNEKFNLTTILQQRDVIVKHFLDSCLLCTDLKADSKLIDVGSGAGLPGIPIKIMRSDIDVLLLDGSSKRVDFLQEVIKELGLKNIKAMHSRCEPCAHNPEYREKFDYAVARAVAPTNVLAEYNLPFVKLYGYMVAYKSKSAETEMQESAEVINILGGKLTEIKNYKITEIDAERNMVFIQKKFKTPVKYPRGQNKPRTNPL